MSARPTARRTACRASVPIQTFYRGTHDNELSHLLSDELDDGVLLLRRLRLLLRNIRGTMNVTGQVPRPRRDVRQMTARIVLREPDAFGFAIVNIEKRAGAAR